MTGEFARQFNDQVERYRKALVYFSRASEWDAFKERAGSLFEYLEQVEAMELERRFYALFYRILVVLALGMVVLIGMGPRAAAGLLEFQQSFVLASLAGCGFELFFYLNFRWYAGVRLEGLQRRRAAFLRDIENDFRSFRDD